MIADTSRNSAACLHGGWSNGRVFNSIFGKSLEKLSNSSRSLVKGFHDRVELVFFLSIIRDLRKKKLEFMNIHGVIAW